MQILQRYFFREMALNFLGVTGALAAVLFIYQLGAVLARAAQFQYPRGLVLELFALGAAENFALLLPLGLLLGIVMALGRLYHEGEMVAARACGYGGARAWLPALMLTLPILASSAWLNLRFSPQAAARRAVLTAEATVAQRARRELGADGLSQTIVLLDGERVEGVPGSRRYRILKFRQLSIPLAAPMPEVRHERVDERPSSQLLGSGNLRDRAELQWRLGFPLMVLVAAACAMPLGRLRPRQGRYERVWRAVILFVIYGQLAVAARTWFERGTTPALLGLWWVHALFLALAAWLVWEQEWRPRRKPA